MTKLAKVHMMPLTEKGTDSDDENVKMILKLLKKTVGRIRVK
jgi:hypothetical protein